MRFFVWVHIDPLRVLDQLPLHRLRVTQPDDAGRERECLGKLRGPKASGSGDKLEAVCVRTHRDGLHDAMLPDGLGKLSQLAWLEGLAGVGGGFVDGVDGNKLKFTAVLHDGPPWGWL